MYMQCPKCGRTYKGLARYCADCGVELIRDKNRCSAMSTSLCKSGEFDDGDTFCRYCGALTTYALERQKAGEFLPDATHRETN